MSTRPNDNEQTFQKLKINLSKELNNRQVESLAWLAEEQFSDPHGDAQEKASRLIQTLKETCKIRPDIEDYSYLKRLLTVIGCLKLAQQIPEPEGATAAEDECHICEQRIRLYKIASRLTEKEVEEIRLLSELPQINQPKSGISLCVKLTENYGDIKQASHRLAHGLYKINRDDLAERIDVHFSPGEKSTISKKKETGPRNGFNFPIPKEFHLNGLIVDIENALSEEEFKKLKFLCVGDDGIPEGELVGFTKPLDFFMRLRERKMISEDNLLFLQCMLRKIDRNDLNKPVIEYAERRGNVLHVYKPKTDENANKAGYGHCQFHIKGDFKSFWRDDMEDLRTYIAGLLAVKPEVIFLVGVDDSGSIILTFRIHEKYAKELEKMVLQHSEGFAKFRVDSFHMGISDPLDLTSFTPLGSSSITKTDEQIVRRKSIQEVPYMDTSSNEDRIVKDVDQEIEGKPLSDDPGKLDIQEPLPQKLAQDEQRLKTVEGQDCTVTTSGLASIVKGKTPSSSKRLDYPSVRAKAWPLKEWQATKEYTATTSGLASIVIVKGKTPTSSKRLGYPSVTREYSFRTAVGISKPHDMLYLPGGLILLSEDGILFLLDMKGNFLKKYVTIGPCCLAALGEERVACLDEYKRLTILHVSSSCIKKESECKTRHGYKCITALDSNTLAAFRYEALDIISLSGKILRSFGTSEDVERACVSKDGSLVCAHLLGILKIDPTNGAELHKSRETFPGYTIDVATTGDNLIIVSTEKGIDLYDSQCVWIKALWSPRYTLWPHVIFAYDDAIVCCTKGTLNILELTY